MSSDVWSNHLPRYMCHRQWNHRPRALKNNSDKQGFALVNQSAQTGAAVANVTSIVKLTAGLTPFLNLQTNTFAATIVLLKITAKYREDKGFDTGEVISLVGNLVGWSVV
ncbi:hypothetical protein [Pseudomonas guariconensis]|uniref:hypothetical protein n=1 Tax=Pseudomonas guariconensis TaxID=1288410 RepID=UPI002B05D784|nr:hypothetical protein [Pseudomonas guariconensis]